MLFVSNRRRSAALVEVLITALASYIAELLGTKQNTTCSEHDERHTNPAAAHTDAIMTKVKYNQNR